MYSDRFVGESMKTYPGNRLDHRSIATPVQADSALMADTVRARIHAEVEAADAMCCAEVCGFHPRMNLDWQDETSEPEVRL